MRHFYENHKCLPALLPINNEEDEFDESTVIESPPSADTLSSDDTSPDTFFFEAALSSDAMLSPARTEEAFSSEAVSFHAFSDHAPVADALSSDSPLPETGAIEHHNEEDNEAIFYELVQKHTTRLHRFIIKHIGNCPDAEDLTQQAFLEASKCYRSFRGDSQLSTWLYGIALNLVRNYLSRAPECRYFFVSEDVLIDHASQDPSPDEAAEQKQMLRLLEESISELPENMRNILLMMGLNDLSYEEAAERLAIPVGTVRSRLSRARTALRAKLQTKGVSGSLI